MKDQHEQEAVESKVRRLETEVSTLTTEIENLKSQLDHKQSLLSENYHEGSRMPYGLPGIENKEIESGINKDFVERLLEYFNGVFVSGIADGKALVLSGDFEKVTGYSKNELEFNAHAWTSLIHSEDLNSVQDEINRLTSVPGAVMKGEFRIVRKDGDIRYLNVFAHSRTVRAFEPPLIQAVMFDISARKEKEKRAISNEKRKALKDTAGGVAHNFNNILQVILSGAQLIESDLRAGNLSEVSEVLELILRNCKMGAQIVKRLGAFAGNDRAFDRFNNEFFDLGDAARSALAYIENWLAERPGNPDRLIKLQTEIENDLYVWGSKNEISRVISVIIKNAFEAIESNGNVRLLTRSDTDKVILEVSDTGVGVKQDHQDKIFTPFFSTKTRVGSGLGLPVAMKIVEDHGGQITFRSTEKYGSVFRVQLPKAYPVTNGKTISDDQMTAGTKKILLIDDDKTVLNFLRRRISALGYDVDAADSGFKGLSKFKDKPTDIILCDLALPGMNGLEIAKEIKRICVANDINKPLFIILTGWNADLIEKDKFTEFGIDEILQKPVDISKITSIIDSFA